MAHDLVRKTLLHVRLGVRVAHDIHRLALRLQRTHHVIEKILLRREVGSDHVFACRTNRHAIRGLVIRTEGEALPGRNRFRILHTPPVIFSVATIGHGFNPICKSAHELPVIMRVASGEIERAVRADGTDRTRGHAQLAFEARVVVEFL